MRARARYAAHDPVALVVVLVGGNGRGPAVRAEVDRAVATHDVQPEVLSTRVAHCVRHDFLRAAQNHLADLGILDRERKGLRGVEVGYLRRLRRVLHPNESN